MEYPGHVWVVSHPYKKSSVSGSYKRVFAYEDAAKNYIDQTLREQADTVGMQVGPFEVWSWDGNGWAQHEVTPGWKGVEIAPARRTVKVTWAESALRDAVAELAEHANDTPGHPLVVSAQAVAVAIDCIRACLGEDQS